jgi:hypothetical protein
VRIPPIPGPQAVLGGAVAAAEAVETAIGLVPRLVTVVARVEQLLDRVEAVVTRIEGVATSADEAAARTHTTIDHATQVTSAALEQANAAKALVDRMDSLLAGWEPTLDRVAPAARRFAESLDEHEVDAAIALIDRLPRVLEHLDQDVLPVLKTLDRVGPDVHELLEVVQDLRRVITGLPGVNLLRRRGDDEPHHD